MNWEEYRKNRPWSNLDVPTLQDNVICAKIHIEQSTVPDTEWIRLKTVGPFAATGCLTHAANC